MCTTAQIKPFLASLHTELKTRDLAVLRAALAEDGAGVGQLALCLSHSVPNSISVFFSPGACCQLRRARERPERGGRTP